MKNFVQSTLSKADVVKETKPWVGQDGLEIPKDGTPQRDSWNKSFLKNLISSLGVKNKTSAIKVNVNELIPRNKAVNSSRLNLYTKMAKAGESLPPIAVERTTHGWLVVDGNHRSEAWMAAKRHKEPMDAIDVTPPGSYFYDKKNRT